MTRKHIDYSPYLPGCLYCPLGMAALTAWEGVLAGMGMTAILQQFRFVHAKWTKWTSKWTSWKAIVSTIFRTFAAVFYDRLEEYM